MITQKSKIKNLFILSAFLTLALTGCKSGEKTTGEKSVSAKKQAEAIQSTAFKNLFFKGITKKSVEDYEEAGKAFRGCLKMAPDHPATLYQLGIIAKEEGNRKYALDYFKRAVDNDAQNKWYLNEYAEMLIKTRKFDEAAVVYRDLLNQHPNTVKYYYDLSNSYIFAGDIQSAVNVYDELEKKTGFNEDVTKQKIKLHQNLGNDKQVEKEMMRLIENNPQSAEYQGMLAKMYRNQGETEKALEVFKKLKELDSDNPLIHLSLADYYEDAQKYDKAFEERKAAFAHPDLDIDNKIQMLMNYYRASSPGEKLNERSYELLNILEETHGDDPKTFAMYGDFLTRDNRNKEAREKYRKSLELDSSRFAIWNRVLIINSELEDVESIIIESKAAMDLFPSQPMPYLMNGLGNLQNENYEKASSSLEQGKNLVLDNKPMELQFYSSLGDAYYNLKNYSQAWLNYERALKIDPANDYVLNNYAYFLSLRKEKLDRAREMALSTVKRNPNSPTYLDTYGWVLYQSEKFEQAEEYLKRALNNNGSTQSEILNHYGDVQFKLGNKEKAREYWQKALKAGGNADEINPKIQNGITK